MKRALSLLVLTAAACGGDSAPTPEIVVANASIGNGIPHVLAVTSTSIFWTTTPTADATLIGGAELASLPATGAQLASSAGPVAAASDRVVFVSEGTISRVDTTGVVGKIVAAMPDALGATGTDPTTVAWSTGADVSWGSDDSPMTVTLSRVDRCDHIRMSPEQIFVATVSGSERRLVRIDAATAAITPVTSATLWSTSFPGGGMPGATYTGRIVDVDADSALWLVEETPSRRAVVVDAPIDGEPTPVLTTLQNASGFFVTPETFYWQEGDELLAAPRAGGGAEIVMSLPGAAGAVAAGYVYYTDGAAIARLRVD